MTIVATSDPTLPAVDEPRSLWTLTRIETRRLVRQPVFVFGVLMYVWLTARSPFVEYADAEYTSSQNLETNLDFPLLPAFFLGLGGLLAMNRITSSSERTGELLDATPVSRARRTAALCLACLLPAAIALVGSAYYFYFLKTNPPVQAENWGEFSDAELVAILACGVLAALGASLVGVLVARWWRWPTAAAVTTVVLILWCMVSLVPDHNALTTANHMASPFTLVASNADDWSWHMGGSWLWRVGYVAGLCALAALGACAQGSEGAQRRRMTRWAVVLGVLTLTFLVLSVATGPEGFYSWDDR